VSAPEGVTGDYFFVRRPIVAIVISIVTVLLGLVDGPAPIAQYPDIVLPEIRCRRPAPERTPSPSSSPWRRHRQQVNGVDYMPTCAR
jgi:HAE1 family hydrophobic/amphiphilic exporter-1